MVDTATIGQLPDRVNVDATDLFELQAADGLSYKATATQIAAIGFQTPWTSSHDANDFNLFGVANITMDGLTGGHTLDVVNGKIINLANPVDDQDAVTKAYGDANYAALNILNNDLDANRFDETEIGVLYFSLSGPRVSPVDGTLPYLCFDQLLSPTALILNTPLSQEFQFRFNDVEEYSLDDGAFDFHGNELLNAPHDHSDAANGGQLTNSALTIGVYSSVMGLGIQIQQLDMGGFRVTNAGVSVDATDLVTKAELEALALGFVWKTPGRASTTGNITLSGLQTIDGVTLVAADRVLVKNQTDATENGIYEANVGSWTRTTDADDGTELEQATIFVQEGDTQSNFAYTCTSTNITIDVTDIVWIEIFSITAVEAGSGLSFTGNILNIGGTTDRITVGSTSVDIAATYAGQASITTVSSTLNTHSIPVGTPSTFALYSDNLSVFASTSSLELFNLLSNKTGSGNVVFSNSPILFTPEFITPTIVDFDKAQHSHSDAANGGQLIATTALNTGVTTPDDTKFLRGDNTWDIPAGTGDASQWATFPAVDNINANTNNLVNVGSVTAAGGGDIGELDNGFNYFVRDTIAWESNSALKIGFSSSGIDIESNGSSDDINITAIGANSDISITASTFLILSASVLVSITGTEGATIQHATGASLAMGSSTATFAGAPLVLGVSADNMDFQTAVSGAALSTPSGNNIKLFNDSDTGELSVKHSTGTVVSLEGVALTTANDIANYAKFYTRVPILDSTSDAASIDTALLVSTAGYWDGAICILGNSASPTTSPWLFIRVDMKWFYIEMTADEGESLAGRRAGDANLFNPQRRMVFTRNDDTAFDPNNWSITPPGVFAVAANVADDCNFWLIDENGTSQSDPAIVRGTSSFGPAGSELTIEVLPITSNTITTPSEADAIGSPDDGSMFIATDDLWLKVFGRWWREDF